MEGEQKTDIFFESPAGHFRSRRFGLFLVWFLILSAALGTFVLSRTLQIGTENVAGAYLGGGAPSYEIMLYDDKADPSSLIVEQGKEVKITVKSGRKHNIAEERTKKSDARLESGELGEGESYSLVFRAKGVFSFYDRLNQDIQISITVK